jgi:hypothetical protein
MQATYMQSPSLSPQISYGFPASPPPWAVQLLDEMKFIKDKVQSIESIEKNSEFN